MSAELEAGPERCAHCRLPLGAARGGRPGARQGPRFCCSGCALARYLSSDRSPGSADSLLTRFVVSAFLAMGVMVFSLSLYGGHLGGGDEAELASEAAHALRGVFRLGAMALSTCVLWLLFVPLARAVADTGRWLSADGLILLGTSAAWIVSVWNTLRGGGEVYFETATMVVVLVTLGRALDVRARERARNELETLLPERVQAVTAVREGLELELAPSELRVDDVVRFRPGELVAVDGIVLEGRAFLDTSSLTGEAEPTSAAPGERVLAGSTLLDGTLLVRARAVVGERVRDEVERLLGESMRARAGQVLFADRLAGALIPLVVALAAGTALFHWEQAGAEQALLAALSVVLISCPCALGIATPLAYWLALARAWRAGALVRGGEVLERLARVRRMAFDKTGTLSSGELELRAIHPASGWTQERALAIAAAVEHGSEHPVGRAIRRAAAARLRGADSARASDFRALPGVGVEARVDGRSLRMERAASTEGSELGLRSIALSREGEQLAVFELAEHLRPEARAVLAELRELGLEVCVLTGDSHAPAQRLARELGLPVESELLPSDKVRHVRGERHTAFVGDGLNDAAALAAAGVGIALSSGSAKSLDAADIGILRPSLEPVPALVRLARRTVRVARQNLAFGFAYNSVGLWFAGQGRLSPILAAAAMVGSSLFVVLNTQRLQRGAVLEPKARGDSEPEPGAAASPAIART